MTISEIQTFIPVVLKACAEASKAIMEIYETDFDPSLKTDGSPLTKADLISNSILKKALEQTGIPVIMEEIKNSSFEIRKTWETVWVVDPLDGTKEFIQKNGEFAVCVALVHQNQSILGFIASPVKQEIIFGGTDFQVNVLSFDDMDQSENWKTISPKTELNNPLKISGSRSHQSGSDLEFTESMRELFGEVEFEKKGSALKFFDLALGKADVYPRFAPTMEWDIAAGQAIMEALGGIVEDPETNQKLTYNKESLYNPYFVVKTKAFIDRMNK